MVDPTRRCKEGISYSPPSKPPAIVLGLPTLWYNWTRKSYHVQWTQILEWHFSGEKRKLEDAAVHTDLFYSRDNKNEGEGSLGQSCVPC